MRTVALASLALLGPAFGVHLGDVGMTRKDDLTEVKVRRYIDSTIEPLVPRQAGTSTVNITQWNANVLSSCSSTLQSLNGVAGNPSGIAACYNIPFWDNSTGVFHADLRLFTISQPTDSFSGIAPADVKVDLSYTAATVQSVDNAALRRRDYDDPSLFVPINEFGKRASQPSLSQSYALYGKLDQGSLGSDPNALQNALLPTVSLSGTNAQGQSASTTVSMDEAAFLVGSFAQQKSVTQANVAASQGPLQTLVVGPGETFVLPGTQILITPIGVAITGTWALLLAMTVGYGTVSRLRFKDQYRRRVERVMKGQMRSI